MTFYIGAHQSFSKGFKGLITQAELTGANVFQFFMRNPRGGKARRFDEADAAALKSALAERDYGPMLCHAPYTLNPCSDKEHVRALADLVMAEDLSRLDFFQNHYYNLHPGSHVGRGIDLAIADIVALLDRFATPELQSTILLETMAGQGTEVGGRFEELADIIQSIRYSEKVGVCLDTCHIFSAGYDIVNDLDGVLTAFDRIIGLNKLKAVHLNDSKMPLGSRKDRHEKIGLGMIGHEAILRLINHPVFSEVPFYLETPNEIPGYAAEIAFLKEHRSS